MTSATALCLTFNCAQAFCSSSLIQASLSPIIASADPDLVFFALQELAPIPDVFLWRIADTYLEPFVTAAGVLGYSLAAQSSAGLTFGLLFSRKSSDVTVTDARSSSVTFGYFETGLKGAAAVRVVAARAGRSVELTFVAAHLAANEGNRDLRDHNYKDVARKLAFFPPPSAVPGRSRPRDFLYKDNTHVFVLGDLNYRVDLPSKLRPSASKWTHPPDFTDWLEFDELTKSRQASTAFIGFTEHDVAFAPTYKFTSSRAYSDSRIPSWCDRVLCLEFDTKPPPVTTLAYDSLPSLTGSDHIPVYAVLKISLEPPGPLSPSLVASLAVHDIASTSAAAAAATTARGQAREREREPAAIAARQTKLQDRHIAARAGRIRTTETLLGLFFYAAFTSPGRAVLLAITVGFISAFVYWRMVYVQ